MRHKTILVRDVKKFREKFEVLRAQPRFESDIQAVRKKWIKHAKDEGSYSSGLFVGGEEDVVSLIKKYKLTPSWSYLMSIYIQSGEFEPMADPLGIEIFYNDDKKFGFIKVWPHTNSREVRQAYSYLQRILSGQKFSKPKALKNETRDIDIYRMRTLEKRSYKEIREAVGKKYGSNHILDDSQLKKVVTTIKKRNPS